MNCSPLIALLLMGLSAEGQAPYERVEVIEVPGVGADELYRRAERWFVDAFRDADEVIQLRDTLSNMLVGKGIDQSYMILRSATASHPFGYSVEIQTKDGRARVRLYDVYFQNGGIIIDEPCCTGSCGPIKGMGKNFNEDYRAGIFNMCADIHAKLDAIIPSVSAALSRTPKDDW